jgi:hypothetical protein
MTITKTDAAGLVETLTQEGLISMSAAARVADEFLAPSGKKGARTHPTTTLRWAKVGHLRADGTRVYLAVIRFGRKMMTSRAAILRFFSEQQELSGAAPLSRTPGERQRAHLVVMAELDAAGAK